MEEKKLVLITGASRGIGKAILESFLQAKDEYQVLGTATSKAGLDAIEQIVGGTRQADCVSGLCYDLVSDNPSDLLKQIKQLPGARTPDILINGAAISNDGLAMRMNEEKFSQVLDANVKKTFELCRLCLPTMLRAKFGRIINISSVVAHTGNFGQSNYCAAKGAIEGFSRVLALECAKNAVTVNCVAPGLIDTDMTRKLPENIYTSLLEKVPAGRAGLPADVAGLVQFLAGAQAAYITGQVVHVNGGMYLG